MIVATTIIQFWHAGYLDRLSVEQRRRDGHISQLNAELESQVLALQAANRELDGFAYSMSHVLRSPLRAMHGFSQMVLDNCGDTLGCEDQRRLRVVQSNAAEMSDLLDRIRAFLQLGLQEMTVGPIDMQQAVHAAIAQLEPEFAGRDLQFAVGELPSAEADPVMVRQIWLNLLDNAIKFTAGKTAAMIEVGARSDNKQTTYFVKDNGAGFDMRYVSKLFGVFQQLHDRSQFPGMGTGLAVVNRIVSRHGGRVWAEGEPGGGATIYFSLPATTVRAAAAA